MWYPAWALGTAGPGVRRTRVGRVASALSPCYWSPWPGLSHRLRFCLFWLPREEEHLGAACLRGPQGCCGLKEGKGLGTLGGHGAHLSTGVVLQSEVAVL